METIAVVINPIYNPSSAEAGGREIHRQLAGSHSMILSQKVGAGQLVSRGVWRLFGEHLEKLAVSGIPHPSCCYLQAYSPLGCSAMCLQEAHSSNHGL